MRAAAAVIIVVYQENIPSVGRKPVEAVRVAECRQPKGEPRNGTQQTRATAFQTVLRPPRRPSLRDLRREEGPPKRSPIEPPAITILREYVGANSLFSEVGFRFGSKRDVYTRRPAAG